MKKCLGLLLLAACSSSNSSATLTGSGAFTVTSQFAGPSLITGITGAGGGVILANVDPQPTCAALLGDGGSTFTGQAVAMTIFAADGGSIAAGSYPITGAGPAPSGSFAYLALLSLSDAGLTPIAVATSGTLDLTGVSSATWDGHFDSQLTNFADGGSFGALSGTFSAPVCSQ